MRFPAVAAVLVPLAISCDGGLQPQVSSTSCPVGICGVVHFRGAVPDSTDYVRVVVYDSVPRSLDQLIAFAGFSDPLPLGPDSATYSCCITPLAPGAYAWVLVVWKKLGALDVNTAPYLLEAAGSYLDPADTTRLGVVVVPAQGGARGVDILADFGRMQSLGAFLSPAPAR
ncbi:MAG TPA: hypothetical protein VMF70_15675 [Gemmatimonadales bacterium]|nr:hypothetical protein [Gemmatimonadales bacterium]